MVPLFFFSLPLMLLLPRGQKLSISDRKTCDLHIDGGNVKECPARVVPQGCDLSMLSINLRATSVTALEAS